LLFTMQAPSGSRSISALAFSSNKRFLAAADMSDDHSIHVFDLQQKQHSDKKSGKKSKRDFLSAKVFTQKSDRRQIFQLQWSPVNELEFISVGL